VLQLTLAVQDHVNGTAPKVCLLQPLPRCCCQSHSRGVTLLVHAHKLCFCQVVCCSSVEKRGQHLPYPGRITHPAHTGMFKLPASSMIVAACIACSKYLGSWAACMQQTAEVDEKGKALWSMRGTVTRSLVCCWCCCGQWWQPACKRSRLEVQCMARWRKRSLPPLPMLWWATHELHVCRTSPGCQPKPGCPRLDQNGCGRAWSLECWPCVPQSASNPGCDSSWGRLRPVQLSSSMQCAPAAHELALASDNSFVTVLEGAFRSTGCLYLRSSISSALQVYKQVGSSACRWQLCL
jgi:hypothetical protein